MVKDPGGVHTVTLHHCIEVTEAVPLIPAQCLKMLLGGAGALVKLAWVWMRVNDDGMGRKGWKEREGKPEKRAQREKL